MNTQSRHLFVTGVLIGSLWAFSEVVLGACIRSVALPLRGTLLTGIGVGILFAGFAYTRRPWTIGLAVLTTAMAKVVFAPSFGFGITVINTSAAVLLEGVAVVAAMYALQRYPARGRVTHGLAAATAILCAGTAFYAVGSHLAPCAYLKSFSAAGFLIRETVPWSLLSSLTAPLGYTLGIRWAARQHTQSDRRLSLPAWGAIAACWLCCGVTVMLTS